MGTEQSAAVIVFSKSLRSFFFADLLVDNRLRTEQTKRAPEGERCETADRWPMLWMEDTTAGAM